MSAVVGRVIRNQPPFVREVSVSEDPILAESVGWESRPTLFRNRMDGTVDCVSVFGTFHYDLRNTGAIADELERLAAEIRRNT